MTKFQKPQDRIISIAESRKELSHLTLDAYSDKTITVLENHHRPMAVLVPVEVLKLLAGFTDMVDASLRERLQQSAKSLLVEMGMDFVSPTLEGNSGADQARDVLRHKPANGKLTPTQT